MPVLLYNCSDQPVRDIEQKGVYSNGVVSQYSKVQILEQGGMKYMIVLDQVINLTKDSLECAELLPMPDEWPDKSKIPDYNK